MTSSQPKITEHEITVAAAAGEIYRLIADVTNWPRIFPPTVHVDRLEGDERQERIRIWATANDTAKSWTSRRTLDPGALTITFRQEVSAPPVASMSGTWLIEALSDTSSRVRLLHEFTAVDDDPAGLEWIIQAVERNSRSELAALRDNVEHEVHAQALTFSFTDEIDVAGAAKDVFDFINEADRWDERLPHVATVRLEEETPGLQVLEMDTRASDGSVHTTRSWRVCFPDTAIAYKQVTLPALMSLHTGFWTFTTTDRGVRASSQHTVVLRPENIEKILGPEATVDSARAYVHNALSTNSRATLGYAKTYAESLL